MSGRLLAAGRGVPSPTDADEFAEGTESDQVKWRNFIVEAGQRCP